MTVKQLSEPTTEALPEVRASATWRNVSLYVLRRTALLFVTVVTAVYLTIIIANFGGYVDTIVESELAFSIGLTLRDSPLSLEEQEAVFTERMEAAREAAGLNDPLALRTAIWLVDGLTLDWKLERPWLYGFDFSSNVTAKELILDNLARSLLIFGVSNVLLFGVAVLFALMLSRHYGGKIDRLFIWLSPLSSARGAASTEAPSPGAVGSSSTSSSSSNSSSSCLSSSSKSPPKADSSPGPSSPSRAAWRLLRPSRSSRSSRSRSLPRPRRRRPRLLRPDSSSSPVSLSAS